MASQAIYLDFNGSTPLDPRVAEAMLPWMGRVHGNPHAEHLAGRKAAAAVDDALAQIASLVGAASADVVLTSGATEANNLALLGTLLNSPNKFELWHSSIEHKSVLAVANHVAQRGVAVNELSVDSIGRVRFRVIGSADVQQASERIRLVSVMHANNEIGTIQPIGELSEIVSLSGGLLHVDASQTAGRIGIDFCEHRIDMLTMSSHKLYGPAGIGALVVSPLARQYLRPIMFGGGQQNGIRPGTVPVFLAVGFGAACELAAERMEADAIWSERLAEAFCDSLRERSILFDRLGDTQHHLPGMRCLRFPGVDGDDLVARVAPLLSISTGSACSSGELRVSHVLRAIGLTDESARGVIRVGFGRSSNPEDAVNAAEIISRAVAAGARFGLAN